MTNKAWPKLTIQSISKSGGRFIIMILPPIVVADMNCRSKKTTLTRHPILSHKKLFGREDLNHNVNT